MKEGGKKKIFFVAVFLFAVVLTISFASANIFSDFWNKFTGKVIDVSEEKTVDSWTKWYDRDDPSGSGDYELLQNFGNICGNLKVTNVECQTLGGKSLSETGQDVKIIMSVIVTFVLRESVLKYKELLEK